MTTWPIAACGLALFAAGCRTVPVNAPIVPGQGIIYSHYQAPLQAKFDRTTLGPKYGESTNYYLGLGILYWLFGVPVEFAWGDGGVDAAARDGDIQRVRHVDYEVLNVLGSFAKVTIRAYGD